MPKSSGFFSPPEHSQTRIANLFCRDHLQEALTASRAGNMFARAEEASPIRVSLYLSLHLHSYDGDMARERCMEYDGKMIALLEQATPRPQWRRKAVELTAATLSWGPDELPSDLREADRRQVNLLVGKRRSKKTSESTCPRISAAASEDEVSLDRRAK